MGAALPQAGRATGHHRTFPYPTYIQPRKSLHYRMAVQRPAVADISPVIHDGALRAVVDVVKEGKGSL